MITVINKEMQSNCTIKSGEKSSNSDDLFKVHIKINTESFRGRRDYLLYLDQLDNAEKIFTLILNRLFELELEDYREIIEFDPAYAIALIELYNQEILDFNLITGDHQREAKRLAEVRPLHMMNGLFELTVLGVVKSIENFINGS